MMSGTSARLIYKGKFAAGLHLTPSFLYPNLMARFAARVFLPKFLRELLQQMLGRGRAFDK